MSTGSLPALEAILRGFEIQALKFLGLAPGADLVPGVPLSARARLALPSAPRRAPLRRALRRRRQRLPDLGAGAEDPARAGEHTPASVESWVMVALSRPRGIARGRAVSLGAPRALSRACARSASASGSRAMRGARGERPEARGGCVERSRAPRTFQEILLRLEQFWSDRGCALLQPYSSEVGAGTFNPATFFLACWDRSRGKRVRRAVPQAEGRTVRGRIRIASSSSINTRSSSSPRPKTCWTSTWTASVTSGSIFKKHDVPLRGGRLGVRRPWARGDSAGRSGSTGRRSRSSPTSSRRAATTWSRSRRRSRTGSSGSPATCRASTGSWISSGPGTTSGKTCS